jgi:hypothetical protein
MDASSNGPIGVNAVEKRDPLRLAAILITIGLHVGVLGGLYVARMMSLHHHDNLKSMAFVDAQLVRFGRPRDLSFLPHKEGHVKDKPADIKIAKDLTALPHLEEKKKPDEVDPLKKTHAELFKNLNDDREGVTTNEGSLSGSKAGTAAEAKGDPYILQIVSAIGTAWSVPNTISDAQLANLSADVCLTIGDSGALGSSRIVTGSGNSQFDSSLQAALGTIKQLPPPPDRDIQGMPGRNLRRLAVTGKLCPTFIAPGK